MVPAQLNVVTLGARDLPRLRGFYTALGWEVAIEAEDFCAFRLGHVFLGLFPWEKLAADGQAGAAPWVGGMRGFSLGINVGRAEQVDEIVAAVEKAGAVVTKPPGDPIEFEGRNAYFADPRRTTGRSSTSRAAPRDRRPPSPGEEVGPAGDAPARVAER